MKKKLLLSLVSFLFTLLLVEVAARVWLNNFADPEQLSYYGTFEQIEASQKLLYARHHYLQYILSPNYEVGENKHNSLGYRGDEVIVPKPEGVYRIVAIGESTTYTSSVEDYRLSYPNQLQEILRGDGYPFVEVVNAGVPAYSSWEGLINLEFRVLDLEPDLIIVYHGLNDIHSRFVTPTSAYVGDNAGSRIPYSPPIENFWDRSAILRILRTNLQIRQPLGGLGFRRTFEYVETNYAEQFRNQYNQGTYPSGIFTEVSAMAMLENNPPIFFERNLRSMVAIAKEQNISIIFATFALSPNFEDARASSPEYLFAINQHNEVIKSICDSHNLPCYDFAQDMPIDEIYWDDGRHLNEQGARLKAELFAEFIESKGIIEEGLLTDDN